MTSHPPAWLNLFQTGMLESAHVHLRSAPFVERTTRDGLGQVGESTWNALVLLQLAVDARQRFDQPDGVRMQRFFVDFSRGAVLDDLTGVHDRQMFRDLEEQRYVVGNEYG